MKEQKPILPGNNKRTGRKSTQLNGKAEIQPESLFQPSRSENDHYLTILNNKIQNHLINYISQELYLTPDEIDITQDIRDYGANSIAILQMLRDIEDRFEIKITGRELMELKSIGSISTYLANKIALAEQSKNIPNQTRRLETKNLIPNDNPSLKRFLSEGQKGLWMLQKTSPNMSAYNVPICFRVGRELELAKFQQACHFLLEQYPILNTIIGEEKGVPYQIIQPGQPLFFETEDISTFNPEDVIPYLRKKLKVPFQLEQGPLMRVHLFSRSNEEQIVLINIHHIIFDGISSSLFITKLLEVYQALLQNKVPEIIPSATKYGDFVEWEQEMLASEAGKEHLTYWKHQLSGILPVLELPTDHPRSSTTSFEGQVLTKLLAPELASQIKAFAYSLHINRSVMFLGIFKVLLHRYTNQEDLIIGLPTFGRPQERFNPVIGYFINVLPIRSQVVGPKSFSDFARELQLTFVDGLDHAEYPFPALVRALNVPRIPGISPVFQVIFLYQNFIQTHIPQYFQGNGSNQPSIEFIDEINQEGEYELELEVFEQSETFRLNFKYNPQLFNEETIARMVEHYLNLTVEVMKDPNIALDSYSFLSQTETKKLMIDWNATEVNYPKEKCVHLLFEEQVQKNLDAVAVVFEDETLTYRELDQKSTQLALFLQKQGVKPDCLVGICLERHWEMIVGLLGILKAGGAYVPLDPEYPTDRLEYMLENSKVSVLLTQDRLMPKIANLLRDNLKVVALDKDWAEIQAETKTGTLRREVHGEHLAYVLYTSGSTGRPKGVMIPHRALTNFLISMSQKPGLSSGDRLLAVTTFCFDIAGLELYLPLINGAQVCICSSETAKDVEKLKQKIQEYHPTIMQATPVTWTMLFLTGWKNEERTKILCGGEALSENLKQSFMDNQCEVWNMFGPTETTIWSTVEAITKEEPITLGKPIANTQIYIIDRNLQLTPIGIPGELCIAGDGLARGYLHQPELTAEKFIDNPFEPGAKLYRTGDLARWTPGGKIDFLGRIDHQVKIRGFRIELGEIESQLLAHPEIQDCAVIVKEKADHKQLLGFYTAKKQLTQKELRDFLSPKLPEYMIPASFIPLDTMPLTPNGKHDRKALSNHQVIIQRTATTEDKPHYEVEKKVLGIWKDVLHRDEIGLEEGFFDVGGDSFLAVAVAHRIKEDLNCDFSVTELFQYANIQEISQYISKKVKVVLSSPPDGMKPKRIEEHRMLNIAPDQPSYPDYYQDSIAIIGVSCQFPGARNYLEFWNNLRAGKESLKFFSKDELVNMKLPKELIENPNFVPIQAAIEDRDLFDPGFFNISPRDVEYMDPQFRLLLLNSWKAVEDAGYIPKQIPETGVFMTAGNNLYSALLSNFKQGSTETDDSERYVSWLLGQGGTIPTMISHKLGFVGPSFFVHSNCSSSLVAINSAVQSLRSGESKYALVGAASISCLVNIGYIYEKGLNFSSDGHLKAFDASADGMVDGEGVAVIVLKRASDAVDDGDNIYAILRGIGINNDGADKVGFYAPSVKGQAAVIRKVLEGTKIDPESISYVEAHGTGTKLGDPIEFAALTETYRQYTTKKGYCGIGSVKTNIGHLDTAAGLAGCVKVALSLYYSEVPPSLNYKEPNPNINIKNSPFYVVDKLLELDEHNMPHRAALSSFGIGGTNTHAIFEQYISIREPESNQDSYIIPLSAKNEERLKVYAQELLSFLNVNQIQSKLDLNRLAFTLQVGREAMEARLAFVASNTTELVQKLEAYLGGNEKSSGCFNGKMNQPQAQVQMLEKEEDFKEIIHKWYQKGLLAKIAEFWASGFQIDWEILYSEPKPRRCSLPTYPFAEERYVLPEFNIRDSKVTKGLTDVSFIHPLLQYNTSDLAEQRYSSTFTGREFFLADHVFREQKVLPGVVYLEMARAAVAAATGLGNEPRTITLKNIVWLRPVGLGGEPVQVHIGLYPEENGEIAYEVYSMGETDEAEAVVYSQGSATQAELSQTAVLDLKSLQMKCNQQKVTGTEIYNLLKTIGFDYGPGHQGIETIYTGKDLVLAKLSLPASVAGTITEFVLHPSIMDAALQATIGTEARKSGGLDTSRLYLPVALQELEIFKGTTSDMWALLRSSDGNLKEDQIKKFDIDLCDEQGNVCVRLKGLEIQAATESNFETIVAADLQEPYKLMTFAEVWQEQTLPETAPVPLKIVVCFLSNLKDQQEIIEAFNASGQSAKLIFISQGSKQPGNYNIKKGDRNSYERTFRSIGKEYGEIDSVLYLWALEDRDCIEDYSCIVHILQAMKVAGLRPKRFLLTANYEQDNVGSCYLESWIGFERSLGMLLPNAKIAVIYQTAAANQTLAMKDWGHKLRAELQNSELCSALYQNGKRYIYRIQPLTIPAGNPIFKSGGTYLITGGCGGLGFLVAKYIAKKHPVNLVLTGRSAIDAQKDKQIKLLETLGSQVIYLQSDVCDFESMKQGIKHARERFKRIDGVIHAAGIDGVQSILEKELAEFQKVVDPKIKGTLVLDEVTKDEPLEFICYFSSSAAILGDFGSCDYAVGNRFLMAYAQYRNRQTSRGNRQGKALAINWPLWKDGGMGFGNDQNTKMYLKTSGQRALETEEGLALLEQILGQTGGPYLIIAGQPSRVHRFLGLADRPEIPATGLSKPLKQNRIEMAGLSMEQCLEWDLKELISNLLKISHDKIKWDENLADFGFDSISLAQLANQLTKFYGIEITPAVFFGYSTVEKLLQYFLTEHRETIQNFYRQEAIDLKSSVNENIPFDVLPASNRLKRHRSRFVINNEQIGLTEPIAIIGMSGRFPGARNIKEFWEILSQGKNAVREIPKERFDWRLYYGALTEPGKINCKWCGCIPGVSEFEPLFFEISPKEAETMDPRQRLLLQEAWRALEDAGYGSEQIKNQKIGMFVGVEQGDYQFLIQGQGNITANHNAILAGRLAYFLNLNGPVMAIDTACSSGLVAAHQAILSLRNGECDTAIAAGINLMLSPESYIGMSQAGMFSEDGKCYAFDKRASGMVPGEAVAVVVFKRLARAKADGDPIYAVIKGSGINYDGKTNGIMAPSGTSQANLLKTIYDQYRVNPEEIEYIVTHGTGTRLGDPVEINALYDTFKSYTKRKNYCALTSTKTNFGHTLAAAGLVSLISLVQALQHETIPASLNFEQENDYINWIESPFYVNNVNQPWPGKNGVNRIGAVSAFGMSGTNVHMVVQSYSNSDDRSVCQNSMPYYLLVLSAKTPEALAEKIKDMIGFLQNKELLQYDLAQISYTLLEGRQHFQYRCAVVIQDRESAIYVLRQLERKEKLPNVYQGMVPRNFSATKALEQYGQDLMKTSLTLLGNPVKYQETLLALADLYCQGYELEWNNLFGRNKPQRVNLPVYPFAKERYWVSEIDTKITLALNTGFTTYIHPLLQQNTSDLSEQRYSSTFTGREFFLADHVVKDKKILPGVAYLEMARAAVESALNVKKSDADASGNLIEGRQMLKLNNVIWARPIVADGETIQIHIGLYPGDGPLGENDGEIAFEIYSLTENGQEDKVIYSQGSARLTTVVAGNPVLDLKALQAECNGQEISGTEIYSIYKTIGLDYGPGHQGIEMVYTGPGRVLAKLSLPSSVVGTEAEFVLHPSIMDAALQASIAMEAQDNMANQKPSLPFALQELEVYLRCTGSMWANIQYSKDNTVSDKIQKVDIDICDEQGNVCVRLKGYTSRVLEGGIAETGSVASTGVLMLEPVWRNLAVLNSDSQTINEYIQQIVILCEPGAITLEKIEKGLNGARVLTLHSKAKSIAKRFKNYAVQLFETIQKLLTDKMTGKTLLQLVVASQAEQQVFAGLSGILKTAGLENPKVIGQIIEVETMDLESLIAKLKENARPGQSRRSMDVQVRYQGDKRQVAGWREVTIPPETAGIPWKDGGVYLITGGAGGLGRIFAKEIAAQAKDVTLVLTGRSSLDVNGKTNLKELELNGAKVIYRQMDVTNKKAVNELIVSIGEEFGKLDGIIHSAGVIRDNYIIKKSQEELMAVMAPKVIGLENLDEASQDLDLDFMILFSSTSGTLGNPGQVDYAVANTFMDAYAEYRNTLLSSGKRQGHTLSINWPLWQEGGMQVDETVEKMMQQSTGTIALRTQSGIRALYEGIASGRTQVMVMEGDIRQMRAIFSKEPVSARSMNSGANQLIQEPGTVADQDLLLEKVSSYLKKLLSPVIKLSVERIEADTPMEKYGIDSIMVMELTNQLEKTFGSLSKTLFFEYQTIRELSGYFLETYREQLNQLIGIEKQEETTSNPSLATASEPVKQFMSPVYNHKAAQSRQSRFTTLQPIQEGKTDKPADIAIIGVSGRYPQARNLDEFWQNLRDGRDCITEIPKDRWDHSLYYDSDKNKPGKTYSKWGGFIEGVDQFDPLFFNISPREAEFMDPQERLFLECVYETLEDAGYTRDTLSKYQGFGLEGNIGVYVGVMYEEYQLYGAQAQVQGFPIALSGNPSDIANRVSYFCNFHGPSVAIDTMCSSSLTAIHLACQSIQRGGCELAIAGGVNVSIHPNKYLLLSQGKFSSSKGRCESFGLGGDGYVPGEGVGAVLLKSLSKAVADGDHIYGVIKGSTINHGGKTNGYTVPNPNAQAGVIEQALQEAGIDPRTISYIEAHGTGTSLGDPIEITGLAKAFQKYTGNKQFCAIGSAKSNIGHCESAAGIAGVSKVLLQLKNRQIVPSLHSEILNPNIDFSNTPFIVQQELTEWERPIVTIEGITKEYPRIAGISSFGAGGSNAHIIIEEYIAKSQEHAAIAINPRQPALIILSAKDEERLKEQVERLIAAIRERKLTDANLADGYFLADMAYTLQVGREAMEERLGVITVSTGELTEKLSAFLTGQSGIEDLYRGQVKRNQEALTVITADEEMQEVIQKWIARKKYGKLLDLWVKGLIFDWNKLYGDQKPRRISLPAYPFAKERYWVPEIDTKISLAPNTGITTYIHPLLQQNTSNFSEQRYSSTFTGKEFFLADHMVNAQKVLPGVAYLEMVRAAVEAAATDTLANDRMMIKLKNIAWARPIVVGEQPAQLYIGLYPEDDVFSENGGGEINYEIYDAIRTEDGMPLVYSQGKAILTAASELPVLDLKALRVECGKKILQANEVYETYRAMGIEYGPGHRGIETIYVGKDLVLAKLSLPSSIAETEAEFVLHPSIMDAALQASIAMEAEKNVATQKPALPFALQELEIIRRCTSSMWATIRYSVGNNVARAGGDKIQKLDIDLCDDQGYICVRLKEFSSRILEREIPAATGKRPVPAENTSEFQAGTIMLTPAWETVSIKRVEIFPTLSERIVIVGGTKEQKSNIQKQYPNAAVLELQISDSIDEIAGKLIKYGTINHILWIAPYRKLKSLTDEILIKEQNQGVLQVFKIIKALLKLGYGTRELGWSLITNRTQAVRKNDEVNPIHASLSGLVGSMTKEYPNWNIRLMDLETEIWPDFSDIFTLPPEPEGNALAFRDGEWYRQQLIPVQNIPIKQALYKTGGVYVVIGGAGGIGEAWSEYVIRTYQAQVIWIGRRAKDEFIQAKIDRLASFGPEPQYIAADATKRKALEEAYQEIKQLYRQINGVVHSAIVLLDKSLMNMTEEQFKAALSAKVDVSVRMAQVFSKEPLNFVMFFSSMESFSKSAGQSNYAAGCTFNDAFAHRINLEWPGKAKVMNWGYWGNVGIVASKVYQERMAQAGIGSIEPPEAMDALERLLAGPIDQIALMKTIKPLTIEGTNPEKQITIYPESLPSVIGNIDNHPIISDLNPKIEINQ